MAANASGSLGVLGLVVTLNADVVAPGVFNAWLRDTDEIVQISVAFIVFVQLADGVRVDRLRRSDRLFNLMHCWWPRLATNL